MKCALSIDFSWSLDFGLPGLKIPSLPTFELPQIPGLNLSFSWDLPSLAIPGFKIPSLPMFELPGCPF